MYSKIDSKEAMKTLNGVIQYSNAFIQEMQRQQPRINAAVGELSIEEFYRYLDMLAKMHPEMLHHVYEWGQVGNPEARLFELKQQLTNNRAIITADLLESTSIEEGSTEPFRQKAEVMEKGMPVTINEVNADALFFEIDGEEYFRLGPIVIEHPGGEATRGSFVRAFEEFYNSYFEKVYLDSIKFYRHFSNPQPFVANFGSVKRSGAASAGKAAAESWVITGVTP